MALLFECMLQCARKLLDTADIVRDGDFSPTITLEQLGEYRLMLRLSDFSRPSNRLAE